jgi:hypothetical protein
MFADIREIFALIAHLVSICVRVALPGGVRTVIAESLLLKHQLLILNRSRNRAPRPTPWDRLPKDCDFNQTVDATAFSPGADPAEIPTAVHATSPSETRAERALEGTHRSDPRNEAPQSALRLPAHCATDGSCVRRRDRQGRRASRSVASSTQQYPASRSRSI